MKKRKTMSQKKVYELRDKYFLDRLASAWLGLSGPLEITFATMSDLRKLQ